MLIGWGQLPSHPGTTLHQPALWSVKSALNGIPFLRVGLKTNRRQRVGVDGNFSDWVPVESSVIQGSVMGGLFFIIFIDDIDDAIIDAIIRKFADDTKMAKKIRNMEDARQMQRNLDSLSRWAEKWGMAFNASKCKVMHFGARNVRYEYEMNGCRLEKVKEEKDLGVWITLLGARSNFETSVYKCSGTLLVHKKDISKPLKACGRPITIVICVI